MWQGYLYWENTCKDICLLDYLLLWQHSFSNIKCFEAHNFDPIISNIHSFLTADFSIKDPTDNEFHGRNDNNVDIDSDVTENNYKKPIWDSSIKQQFIDNLDHVVIEEFKTEFARIHNDKNYDSACVNDITKKVSDILINAAWQLSINKWCKNKPPKNSCNSNKNDGF